MEIFLKKALSYFASLSIKLERLMSDNGAAYRSRPIAQFLRSKRIRHIFTKPYTPKTNGKAERFIQTSLREWVYAAVYKTQTTDPPISNRGSTDTTGIVLIAL